MHENREIPSTPWSDDQGRSAKATSRTADMHVLEKSDCAVIPVNQPNKGGQPSAEVSSEEIVLPQPLLVGPAVTCARLGTLRDIKHSRSKTTLFKQGATNNFITSHPSCQMTRGAGTENSQANRPQQKTDEAG